MQIYLEFHSKNDGRGYYLTFESIDEYLKHSKVFHNFPAIVSITDERVNIKLTEPIYHIGNFNNYNPAPVNLKNS